jgi:hypothetical protein
VSEVATDILAAQCVSPSATGVVLPIAMITREVGGDRRAQGWCAAAQATAA